MSPLQLSKAQVSQISGRPDTSGRALNARSFKRRPNDRVSSANRGIAIIGGYSVLLVVIEAKMIDQAVLFMLIIVASQTVVFARSNPRFLTFFWRQEQLNIRGTTIVDGKVAHHENSRRLTPDGKRHAIEPLMTIRPSSIARISARHRNSHSHANDG